MSQAKYKFKTMSERAAENATAVAGLTLYGVGLSQIFNPVALGIAGAYGAYTVGRAALMNVPAYRDWEMGRMVKKGHATQLPDDHPFVQMAKEISEDLGRKQAPKVYTVTSDVVVQIALPPGLRWLGKLRPVRDAIEEKAMPKVFAALPGSNLLMTTDAALNNGMSQDELKFIAAHEMGHLKTDAGSLNLLGRGFVNKMNMPLMLATTAAVALSVFGVGLPVTAGMAAWKAFGALVAIKLGTDAALKLGTRIMERRADRNALYVTRDLEAGQDAMEWLHEPAQKKPHSLLREALLTHPSYQRRLSAMQKSFNHVAKYPPIKPVNDNKTKPAPVAKNKAQQLRA